MAMRRRLRLSDPDYFDYESNGVGIGDAKPRDMSNHEKAALRKREEWKRRTRFRIGFQLPKEK